MTADLGFVHRWEPGPGGVPILAGVVVCGGRVIERIATLIRGGGLYLNDERVTNDRERVTADQAIRGQILVLRKGQRERRLIKLRRRS